MCNGEQFSRPEGYEFFEPADADGAERIAKLTVEQSPCATSVCPLIGQCHKDCMLIMNNRQGVYPTDDHPADSGHRECQVDILCQDHDKFASETVLIPADIPLRAKYTK